MFTRPRYHKNWDGPRAEETMSVGQRDCLQQPSVPRIAMAAGDIQDGSPAQEGRHGGMGGEGPTDSRPTDGPEDQGHGNPVSIGTQGRVGIGRANPRSLIRTGGSLCSRGEVLRLGLSRFPVCTNKSLWKRGGLSGLFPEALCWEALKGQPMIHSCQRR